MILDRDFTYNGINYKYGTETSCEDSGCSEEGICRCTEIVDAHVSNVDIPEIVRYIYGIYFDDSKATKRNNIINSILNGGGKELDIYTIDRILRINKLWDSHSWDIDIESGYYGQELGKITIVNSVREKIESTIDEAFDIDDSSKRVEFLLKLEYGKLLPELENCKFEIIEVKREDINFGGKEHFKNIQSEYLGHYSDKLYNGIRGIAIKSGEKYRLIDGYHRCFSTENKNVKLLIATKND